MRRRDEGPAPDVFEAFPGNVEEPEAAGRSGVPSVRSLARSAGLTLTLMVLTCLGVVGGAWLAGRHQPELAYSSLFWEGVAIVLWAGLWGLLAGAGTLALGVVAVALPWLRHRRRTG